MYENDTLSEDTTHQMLAILSFSGDISGQG